MPAKGAFVSIPLSLWDNKLPASAGANSYSIDKYVDRCIGLATKLRDEEWSPSLHGRLDS